jgi:hypothetical protein
MGEIFTFARLRPIAKLGSFDIGETIAHRLNKTASTPKSLFIGGEQRMLPPARVD